MNKREWKNPRFEVNIRATVTVRDICCVCFSNFLKKHGLTHTPMCFETSEQLQGAHILEMSICMDLCPQERRSQIYNSLSS